MFAFEHGGFMTCGGDELPYDAVTCTAQRSQPHHYDAVTYAVQKSQPHHQSEVQALEDALATYAQKEANLASLMQAQQARAAVRRREETKACMQRCVARSAFLLASTELTTSGEYTLPYAFAEDRGDDVVGGWPTCENHTGVIVEQMRRERIRSRALKTIHACMSVKDIDVAVRDANDIIANVEKNLTRTMKTTFVADASLKTVDDKLAALRNSV